VVFPAPAAAVELYDSDGVHGIKVPACCGGHKHVCSSPSVFDKVEQDLDNGITEM
jgi:hypothetical protein